MEDRLPTRLPDQLPASESLPSLIGTVICIPLGFGVWLVPLHYVETLGLATTLAIIFGIIALLCLVGQLTHSKPSQQNNPSEAEQKTYTV